MWRDETIYLMKIYLFNRLGQFSALCLPFERVDSTVGGTIDRSVSGSEGVLVAERAGPKCCCDAEAALDSEQRRVERERNARRSLFVVERRARNVILGLHLVSRPRMRAVHA